MSDPKDLVPSRVGTPAVEHLTNIIKAGLATAPFCGGLASLMTDYIPSARQARLEAFASTLAPDLERLQKHVDEETIKTDEFAFILEKCFRGAAENYQKEKPEAFRGMLVNTAIGFIATSDEKEFFIRLVGSLSALHMRILRFMVDPHGYLAAVGIPPERIRGGFSDFFPVAIPGVHIDVLKSAFSDLYQLGFINTDKSIFSIMTAGQGLALLVGRVTPLGVRLIQFCSVPR